VLPNVESATRARLRRGIRVAVVVLVVWLVATGALLFLARQRVSTGLDRLQRVRGQLTADALLRGKGLGALEAAERDFASAHRLAANLVLKPRSRRAIRPWGVAGRALTSAADRVAAVGARAARDGTAALRVRPATPQGRIALLDRVAAIAARANQDLNQLDTGPDFFLIGPLGHARARFLDRLHRLREAVANAQALASAAAQVLRGPRHYLVLAANNGEMRAGSGMLLSAGMATFAGGTFTIGTMGPSADHDLPPGAVPVPPALAPLWGWVGPSQHWRNLATSPRFDVTAPLAARMWEAATGQPVDGVLAVDAEALSALLAAQGAVAAGGQEVSASDVVSYLLLGQYAGVPATPASEADRRDQLSAIAQASVRALTDRPWNGPTLVSQLADAGKGRHVLAWARDPTEQRAWEAAGIAGELRPDSLSLSILNFGGNKLDQFLEADATLSVRGRSDGSTDARITVQLHNTAPTDLAGYVAGPYPGGGAAEGVYQGVLGLNVPGGSTVPRLRGPGATLAQGVDGPTVAAAAGYFQVPRGQTVTFTASFRLPPGLSAVTVEPSARLPATRWHFRALKVTDARAEHLTW
jgi:hypothetical protein